MGGVGHERTRRRGYAEFEAIRGRDAEAAQQDAATQRKQTLDEALDLGLEDTFPGIGPGRGHPAAAQRLR